MKTSTWQTFTQVLHPTQNSGSKITGAFGVVMFGKALILI
jgi:hypothetical protein